MRQLTTFGKQLFTLIGITIGVVGGLVIINYWDNVWPFLVIGVIVIGYFIWDVFDQMEKEELKDRISKLEKIIDQ